MPYDLDVFSDFNSDVFIDLNSDGLFTDGEPIYENNNTQFQIDGTWDYDEVTDIPDGYLTDTYSVNLVTSKSSIYVDECQDLVDNYEKGMLNAYTALNQICSYNFMDIND